ncbi:MAG: hypothetical protein AAFO77_15040 [Pseudomonadota bacterium]
MTEADLACVEPSSAPSQGDGLAQLQQSILECHDRGDGAGLATLYFAAAETMAQRGEMDAAAFFMTHAYVFALETGHPLADRAHRFLINLGREV